MIIEENRLGYFVTYSLWRNALKLLNLQIEAQSNNKHFKTISMISYKRLGNYISKLESEDYFNRYVANNLFYGLENWFSVYPYVTPKAGLGLRNYKYFTYPLLAVYYSVGLYLMKLSTEYICNYYGQRTHIKSFYGGNMHFEKNDLLVTKNNIYFATYYRLFRNLIRRESKNNIENKVIIRLDIQNYYDDISIPCLMDLIEENIKPSILNEMKFDITTKNQIGFFFNYLSFNEGGIPQSDNSIMSSFIGYLYLIFGDMLIEGELSKNNNILDDYQIIRYVDDIYISITFIPTVDENERKAHIESIGARIADLLYSNLKLRLNPKTRFFWLNNPQQLKELISSLKKVSPEYHLSDEADDEPPSNKIDNIIDELENLKKSSINPESFSHDLRDEILKEVFDERVNQMLAMKSNQDRIQLLFDGFNFNLVKEYPLPIIIIILKEAKTAQRFKKFLLTLDDLSTRDIDLIIKYLCQNDFKDVEVLKWLKKSQPKSNIINFVLHANLNSGQPGYYGLKENKILKLAEMPYVIEQIRYRVVSERIKSYSVAINHLVNEIHAICYELDNPETHKKYDVNNVIRFLNAHSVSPTTSTKVRNLFDRRNTNQISHPGSDEYTVWSVSQHEYKKYHASVGKSLAVIL